MSKNTHRENKGDLLTMQEKYERSLMFEVRNKNGHWWRFYFDGTIEGFEDEDIVVISNLAAPMLHAVLGKMVQLGADRELIDYLDVFLHGRGPLARSFTETQGN